MEVNRSALLDDLLSFALRGNGVVIGRPGVGKTYLLIKLRHELKSRGIPHLLLPIDQLGEGTEVELRTLLSYKGDLIAKLRNEIGQQDNQPGILLFAKW